jgi:predicted nucleic acid-binding protein
MTPFGFVDTNVLLYSISRNPAEADKRARACKLLDREDLALSVQVLQEFYTQATRPNRPDTLPHDLAVRLISAWTRFPVQDVTLSVLNAALEIKQACGFSYWDSAIIAAARALGCRELYTEDLSDGRQLGELKIVNPFRA